MALPLLSNVSWYKDLWLSTANVSFLDSNFTYEPFAMISQLFVGAALAVTASSRALSVRQSSSDVSPGYSASNVEMTAFGLTADLTLAGPATNTYGNDIENLKLTVNYDTG